MSGRRKLFPLLKCAAYLAILLVLLLRSTRALFFA